MRSIFFVSELEDLNKLKKELKTKYGENWGDIVSRGKLQEIPFPKDMGTDILKFGAKGLEKSLLPAVRVLEIGTEPFKKFLIKEGAKNNSWLIRFWDIAEGKKSLAKTITIGRETLEMCDIIAEALPADKTQVWAGVTFSHPDLEIRTQIYRYPTASICLERIEATNENYQKLKKRFIKFLENQI